jgi:hypothetical protein
MLVGVALVVSILSACSSSDPVGSGSSTVPSEEETSLAGRWERAESTFTSLDGMVVEVAADGGSAVVIAVPDNEFQFQEGDVKWRMIEPMGEGRWSFEDLVRESGSGATSWVSGEMSLAEDGAALEMTFSTGTTQEWVRSDDA